MRRAELHSANPHKSGDAHAICPDMPRRGVWREPGPNYESGWMSPVLFSFSVTNGCTHGMLIDAYDALAVCAYQESRG